MSELIWILSSCVLILAVLAIRALFGRKLRPGLRCVLWGLVLVRLLLPGNLWTSPVSVGSAASGTRLGRELTTLEDVESLTLSPDGRLTGTLRGGAAPNPAPAATPAAPDVQPSGKTSVTIAENATAREYTRMSRALTLRRAFEIVWLAGGAVTLAVFFATNVSFYVNLRRRRERLEADCPVRVYMVEGLESSCLFLGAVYVNGETAESQRKLRHVLAHELSHRRHGDGLWSLLRCAALTIHWFNPLVWVAASKSRQDSELFADAGALKKLGDAERESYGGTLISLSVHSPRAVSPLCAATTMSGGKKALRTRVEQIARKPKATVAVLLTVAIIAGIAVGCTFAGASDKEDNVLTDSGSDAPGSGTPDTDSPPEGGIENAQAGSIVTTDDDAEPQVPADPNHYYYTGDGWTMEAPKTLGGDPDLPLNVTVTTGDGGSYYYLFRARDDSSLSVYRDPYSTARERYEFMAGTDGRTGNPDKLMVSYVDAGSDTAQSVEEYYIDTPDGGHWEIRIASAGHMDELREMTSTFRVTPETEPVIASDVALKSLLAGADLNEMTITRIENGVSLPSANAANSPHGAEYLDILRSLHWADDLNPYDGADPGWCVVLETPDFRIVFNDTGWAGVTAPRGAFQAWIVNYEELSHEANTFGWDHLTRWYDEAEAQAGSSRSQDSVKLFEYGDLQVEVTNVTGIKTGRYAEDENMAFDYDVYVLSPGATLTVRRADSFTDAETGLPRTDYALYFSDGSRTDLLELTDTVELTPDVLGIISREASAYVLGFEWGDAGNRPGEPITAEELALWAERLTPESYNEETGEWAVSPINGFFLSDWTVPRELDFAQFVAYFPISTELSDDADAAEREAVHVAYFEKYGEAFTGGVPTHAIRLADINAILTQYAGITVEDLSADWRDEVLYIPEYDTVYTFTSDYGPGFFTPVAGIRDGGIVTLYSEDHVLTIEETNVGWRLLSHMPV